MIQDYEEVEIAMRAFLTPGNGPEQDDPRRLGSGDDVRHDSWHCLTQLGSLEWATVLHMSEHYPATSINMTPR